MINRSLMRFGTIAVLVCVLCSHATGCTPSRPLALIAPPAEVGIEASLSTASVVLSSMSKRRDNSTVIIGHEYTLRSGETQNEDLVLIGSHARIEGTVNGDVVLIGARCSLNGTINGDLVSIASDVETTTSATIHGDYVSILSAARKHSELELKGDRVEIDLFTPAFLAGFHHWFAHTILLLRPMSPTSNVSWIFTLVSLAFCLAIGFFFPRPVAETGQIIQDRAPASFLCGIAIVPATAFLCFLLLLTVVGIFAIPFVLAAVLVFSVAGNAALFQLIGRKIAPHLGQPRQPDPKISEPGVSSDLPDSPIASPHLHKPEYVSLVWICLGAVICWVSYSIPVVGFLTGSAVFVLGLGAFTIYLLERTRAKNTLVAPPAQMNFAQNTPLALPVTPESVQNPSLAHPADWAGFGARLLANLIDLVVLYLALSQGHGAATRWLVPTWVLYRFGMYFWRSATLGQIVLNLQVRKEDGGSLRNDSATCAVRALASLVSLFPAGLGFIWILFDPQRRAWHDKISRTDVVRAVPTR
jgi:uncharacterized RDD family membrane protein YckC